jgi:hypothetical protein
MYNEDDENINVFHAWCFWAMPKTHEVQEYLLSFDEVTGEHYGKND